jgi:hypothetical protein
MPHSTELATPRITKRRFFPARSGTVLTKIGSTASSRALRLPTDLAVRGRRTDVARDAKTDAAAPVLPFGIPTRWRGGAQLRKGRPDQGGRIAPSPAAQHAMLAPDFETCHTRLVEGRFANSTLTPSEQRTS